MPEFFFDDSGHDPLFERPALLTHHTIPGGLAGVNPRTIFGAEWWDQERRVAYEKNHYCCHACSIHGSQDPIEQRLEAHECYEFDYVRKRATYTEVVALCWTCHSFIHCGRLWARYRGFQVARKTVAYVIQSRLALLRTRNLKPFYWAAMIELMLKGQNETQAFFSTVVKGPYVRPVTPKPRQRWRLIIEGETYYGSK